VTERSPGRLTPGVDGKVYLTADAREQLSREKFDYRTHKPSPARRVYIPKPSGGKRPLSIPTIRDRVMQAIVKMALEPEWEAKFAADSYGFRPGRSCHDAIEAVRQAIREMENRGFRSWVFKADIASCFDRIAHAPLLGRLHLFRGVVQRWLMAGVVEFGHYEPTEAGTPQGGVISPLLANIALDGIEGLFAGKWWARVVRYADDLVVVAATQRIIERAIQPAVEQFLAERGLALNPLKSGIVNLELGFNFLGFTTRMSRGKLLIFPQAEKVQRFLQHLKAILVANKQTAHKDIITKLNPTIRGWANYFRHCNARWAFSHADNVLFRKLWWWACRRHPKKSREWVRQKYFQGTVEKQWTFGEKGGLQLTRVKAIHIFPHAKVYGRASPLDARLRAYWEKRYRKAVAVW
jgi:RNA-directed DNA polymerase